MIRVFLSWGGLRWPILNGTQRTLPLAATVATDDDCEFIESLLGFLLLSPFLLSPLFPGTSIFFGSYKKL